MLGHDHHLAAPAGAPGPGPGRGGEVGRNRSATSLRAAASQARVESWLPTRYSTLAPGRPARRRRASPIGAAAGPSRTRPPGPRGSRRPGAGRGCRRRGRAAPGPGAAGGVEQLAQLGRGREVVAGPGVGQVQVRDVDEPAAGLEAKLQVERAGFGDDELAHHRLRRNRLDRRRVPGRGTGRLGGPWTPRRPASRCWPSPGETLHWTVVLDRAAHPAPDRPVHHQRRPRGGGQEPRGPRQGGPRGQGRRPVPGPSRLS